MKCNEIQTLVPPAQEDDRRWISTSRGGKASANDKNFEKLNEGVIDDVAFGKSAKINLNLEGKKVVPDSIGKSEPFSVDFAGLYDEREKVIIGKSLVFHDPWSKMGFTSNDTGQTKTEILLGAFYYNSSKDGGVANVPCKYVAGDIDATEVDKGKCVWIDQKSIASNGKPYCW